MLKEKIQEDVKSALKGGDAEKAGALRMLLSVLRNKEIDKRTALAQQGVPDQELQEKSALSDEEIQQALVSEAKKRREAQEIFAKGGRQDLAEKEGREFALLRTYLPEQLSEEEIRALVSGAIQESGAASQKDIRKVLGIVMPKIKGKADGSQVSAIAKELLQ